MITAEQSNLFIGAAIDRTSARVICFPPISGKTLSRREEGK
jgi:hypothetical protein